MRTLVAALERGVRVPGRFEPVDEGQDFAVLVDYAHTPDSLENVLAAARELIAARESAGGRVLCVFGAGGDRDRGKRPLMGEIATRLADGVLVTSDNPRSEDPEQIIAEIMAGVARARDERASVRSVGSVAPTTRSISTRARVRSSTCCCRLSCGSGPPESTFPAWSKTAPAIAIQACPQCRSMKRPHRVCGECGYYDGEPRIETQQDA